MNSHFELSASKAIKRGMGLLEGMDVMHRGALSTAIMLYESLAKLADKSSAFAYRAFQESSFEEWTQELSNVLSAIESHDISWEIQRDRFCNKLMPIIDAWNCEELLDSTQAYEYRKLVGLVDENRNRLGVDSDGYPLDGDP